MKTRFTIRLKPRKWESLSGYLLRVSEANYVDLSDILQYLRGEAYNMQTRYTFKLDILPDLYINIRRLLELTGIPLHKLNVMTLFPVYNKLYSDSNVESLSIITRIITKNKRYICPTCLKSEGYFKLLWQIEEIEICDIHRTKLQCNCNQCGKELPYLDRSYSEIKCPNCGSLLQSQKSKAIIEHDYLMEQLRKYEEWSYILHTNFPLVPEVSGFSNEKAAIIALLYSIPCKELADEPTLGFFNGKYVSGLIANINEKNPPIRRLTIFQLKDILKISGIPIECFSQIKVPSNLVESIIQPTVFQKKEPGPCLAPWCSYYGTNISIQAQSKWKDWSDYFVCSDCCIYYSYRKEDGKWKEINGKIELIEMVRLLVNAGKSVRKISQLTGKGKRKLNEVIGYLAYHQLLSEQFLKKYTPNTCPINPVDCFKQITTLTTNIEMMYKVSQDLFSWSRVEFFYYLATHHVQRFLLGVIRKTNQEQRAEDKWQKNVMTVLERLIQSNTEITVQHVIEELQCSRELLQLYGLNKIITQEARKQKVNQLANELKDLKRSIDMYIDSKEMEKGIVSNKEVYEFIGITRAGVRHKYPEMEEWISERIQLHIQHTRTFRMEYYKNLALESINHLKTQNKPVYIHKVIETMDVAESHLRRRYPEVIEFIYKTRNII